MHRERIVLISLVIVVLVCNHVFAFDNPYKDVPVNRAESMVVKEFKRFEFLESVLSGVDGSIYATNHFEGKLYKINDGEVSILMDIEGELLCLEFLDEKNMLVTGWNKKREQFIYQVSHTGESKILANIPEGEFLNGITRLNDSIFLIADSYKGAIWKLDIADGSVSLWLEHDLLKRPSADEKYPGINGIKVHNNTVYVSNTTKALIVRIPVTNADDAGIPEVFAKGVLVDDFAMDRKGNIYGATHTFNSVIRITPTGDITIIAQSDQGVAGSTSLTWKHGSDDTLLVSTNGGMNSQNKSDVVPAKIVQLRIR